MIKSSLFPTKDEVILSTVTMLVIGGLIYQGVTSLWNRKESSVFQYSHITAKK